MRGVCFGVAKGSQKSQSEDLEGDETQNPWRLPRRDGLEWTESETREEDDRITLHQCIAVKFQREHEICERIHRRRDGGITPHEIALIYSILRMTKMRWTSNALFLRTNAMVSSITPSKCLVLHLPERRFRQLLVPYPADNRHSRSQLHYEIGIRILSGVPSFGDGRCLMPPCPPTNNQVPSQSNPIQCQLRTHSMFQPSTRNVRSSPTVSFHVKYQQALVSPESILRTNLIPPRMSHLRHLQTRHFLFRLSPQRPFKATA